jgi:hypothetical protein
MIQKQLLVSPENLKLLGATEVRQATETRAHNLSRAENLTRLEGRREGRLLGCRV